MATTTLMLREFTTQAAQAGRSPSRSSTTPLLKTISIMMASAAKENIRGAHDPDGRAFQPLAHPRPSGGSKPLNDMGLLGASITSRVEGDTAVAGTNRPGASLHQNGGIITAKRAKFLAIPLTRKAQRSGGPRRFGGKLHSQFRKNARKGVLVDDKGVAQFALVPSVRVPRRPFLGFGRKLTGRIDSVILNWQARQLPGGQ